jgi:hypothetical protein
MMFRTLCRSCEQTAIEKAQKVEGERGVLFVGCSHYQVGATCFVENGEIIDWSVWPAIDANAFYIRAAAIGVTYDELNAGAGLADNNPSIQTRH